MTQSTESPVPETSFVKDIAVVNVSILPIARAQRIVRSLNTQLQSLQWHITQFGNSSSMDPSKKPGTRNALTNLYCVISQALWRSF